MSFHDEVDWNFQVEQLQSLSEENERIKKENEILKAENTRLSSLLETYTNPVKNMGNRYWSDREHQRFLEALEMYGKDNVDEIVKHVQTKTKLQANNLIIS